jgi:hypothetical protein
MATRTHVEAADRIGQRFGRWTIVGAGYLIKYPNHRRGGFRSVREFLCECSCGHRTFVSWRNLYSGATRGCNTCRLKRLYENRKVCPLCACGKPKGAASERCRDCAYVATRGIRDIGWKYPTSMGKVADAIGVSREYVRLKIKALGFDGMIRWAKERNPEGMKGIDIPATARAGAV